MFHFPEQILVCIAKIQFAQFSVLTNHNLDIKSSHIKSSQCFVKISLNMVFHPNNPVPRMQDFL